MVNNMNFKWNEEEYKIIENFKGGNKFIKAKMTFDGKVRILDAILPGGASIGMHKHETNFEVVFIIEGSLSVECDGVKEHLESGMVHYCPVGSTHTLINDTGSDVVIKAVIGEVK